ncbi:MAG: type II toxin-antitoxin system VapB family antitoxin [Acidobacteria bacterium]|nr:type II toxin-antitoxin system VapB family antitoxin [Acidobacteriota bacterium]
MGILMHMWTTLDIDDDLLREAARLTRIQEATTLVNCGLERPCY